MSGEPALQPKVNSASGQETEPSKMSGTRTYLMNAETATATRGALSTPRTNAGLRRAI